MTNLENSTKKQRHIIVTVYLIFMILLNSIMSMSYLFAKETIMQESPYITESMSNYFAISFIANVVFLILLFYWKKLGFYCIILNAIIVISMFGIFEFDIKETIFPTVAHISILFGILQIKKNGISTWTNLV